MAIDPLHTDTKIIDGLALRALGTYAINPKARIALVCRRWEVERARDICAKCPVLGSGGIEILEVGQPVPAGARFDHVLAAESMTSEERHWLLLALAPRVTSSEYATFLGQKSVYTSAASAFGINAPTKYPAAIMRLLQIGLVEEIDGKPTLNSALVQMISEQLVFVVPVSLKEGS